MWSDIREWRVKTLKLNLLESAGRHGVFTDHTPILKDELKICAPCEGTILLHNVAPSGSALQKGFPTKDKVVSIGDFEILQGITRVEFVRDDGVIFDCGELQRNGRFVHVKSKADELIVDLFADHVSLVDKVKAMEAEITEIKTRYGITII